MKVVDVELEVITPMFSYGNNQKFPEIRITEIKSLMRSTFRELYQFKSISDMKEKEKNLFGNTKVKSPIRIKLKTKDIKNEYADMLPHKENKEDRGNKKSIYSSSKIKLAIIGNDEVKLKRYVILLIQASIIGSIGKRSRKGYGSFKVVDIKESKGIEYGSLLEKSPTEILKKCREYSSEDYTMREEKEEKRSEFLTTFDLEKTNLDFPYVTKINFVKISKDRDYITFLTQISQLTHERLPHEEKEKDFIYEIDNNQKIKRTILGNCKCERKLVNRFASPISVSFWENSNDKYMIIKELKYNYIFKLLKIDDDISKKANEEYVYKYISMLKN